MFYIALDKANWNRKLLIDTCYLKFYQVTRFLMEPS